MTRVLVAADSPVARAGLEALVTAEPGLTIAGSAPAGPSLAAMVARAAPDVVLLELEPDEGPARHASRLLAAMQTSESGGRILEPAVVLIADVPSGGWAADALRAGVRALLPRAASAGEVVAAVTAAAAGLVSLHPDIADRLLPPSASRLEPDGAAHATLTPREVEVLNMLAEGLGNKAIAPRLGISEHTVKFHIASIFSKLRASSRTEAVRLGARQGLVLL